MKNDIKSFFIGMFLFGFCLLSAAYAKDIPPESKKVVKEMNNLYNYSACFL